MRRYSLVILVFILLIVNTSMQRFATANPLTQPELWGLRHSLPAGVAGAALLLATLGMGAQVWRGLLPLSGGGEWSPQRSWSYMCVCGLWCGWIPLLCALAFYPEAGSGPSYWLIGGFVALVACRMLSLFCRQAIVGLFTGLMAAAVAVLCGQMLWPATPLDVLVMGLSCSTALYILADDEAPRQMLWLMTTALIFCAYAAAFGYMLAFYPPAGASGATPWSMWVAGSYTALAALLIIFARLRTSLWGRRIVALLALLSSAGWLWLHIAAALAPEEQLPALGFYALALALFGLPAGMMLYRGLR